MEIRELESHHAARYRKIRLEALQYHTEAFSSSYEEEVGLSSEDFEKRLEAKESFTFGAFDQEQLIGIVSLVLESRAKLKHRANIVAMYVRPESRGFGIGKRLMQHAIAKAKAVKGVEQVYLSVTSSNVTAKRMYDSLGFRRYGTNPSALKIDGTYYDDVLMVLFL
ncbi:GNAT family N-acetyltransferase [Cohnella nanjingensis]|uniref:GNAT family N-acetyltransferase n=1 Tax=Cohnella nanjingensis TaxID=1387779 RepID=A0A7X0RW05_9BACL|nr:GNAT family N-acetyltransferase [Cohnella nanjingensis]MBB6674683.1 GNAT family N-acetyltransferase [Cohnella nanjingensis]